jgi:FMN reductase
MATVACIVGSPSSPSRTAFVATYVSSCIARAGHKVEILVVRDLPAEDLLRARTDSPAIAAAVTALERADGVIVATPIYKASFSGILKVFLDLLPQFALQNKSVLPIATGGGSAHVLAMDYGLRPVLMSLGAAHVAPSFVVLEKELRSVRPGEPDGYELAPETAAKLDLLAAHFLHFVAHPKPVTAPA